MRSLREPNSVAGCARSEVRRRGATLIELLVVIALIGLLVGMLIPSLSRSMKIAASTLCKQHLREIGHSLLLYSIENDGWLPAAGEPESETGEIPESEPWFAKLFPTYLNDPTIMTCPEDPYRFRMLRFEGPLSDPMAGDLASYGINRFIMLSGGGPPAAPDRLRPSRPLDTILVADLGPDEAGGSETAAGATGPARNSSLLAWDDGFDPFAEDPAPEPWLTMRHGRGINISTLGGGVRDAQTLLIMRQPVRRYYSDCASGGCTFCNRLMLAHYSFARDRLYWWTGSAPSDQ